jgi:mono/diheme cytochrome c family protein
MLQQGIRRIVSLVSLLMLAGCGLASEPVVIATIPPAMPDAVALLADADLSLGARVFAENCTECHGLSGKGDGNLVQSGQVKAPVDFTGPAAIANVSPEDWLAVIRDGRIENLMPPWGNSLAPHELAAVAMYTYSLSSGGFVPPVAIEEAVEEVTYEVTSDPAAIEISLLLTEIQRRDGFLFVTQITSFENMSDRVFTDVMSVDGEHHASVRIRLPAGAQAHLTGTESYIVSPDGLTVMATEPVLPGQTYTMHVTYIMPFESRAVSIFRCCID